MLPMDAGKILGILGHYLQDVIRRACHQVTFQHIGNPRYRLFKRIEQIIRLSGQRDLDEHQCGQAHFAAIQKGDIAADIAILLKALDTAMASRCGQVHLF
jgi:hypothetical protein